MELSNQQVHCVSTNRPWNPLYKKNEAFYKIPTTDFKIVLIWFLYLSVFVQGLCPFAYPLYYLVMDHWIL